MHIEKFKPTAVRAVIDHDERSHLSTLMRENIDQSRTHLNEKFVFQVFTNPPMSFKNSVKEVVRRIEEQNQKKLRKDANLLASICITLPSNVSESDSKTFFEESLYFITQELKKNGLSDIAPIKAYLHNDESTPHVHLKFVPLLEEDGKLKLNFKKVCPRKFYQSIHTDLQKHLTPILGYPPKVLLDTNDPLRALSPESQKRYIQLHEKIIDETAKITNEQQEKKNELEEVKKELEDSKKERDEVLDEKKDLGLTLQNLQSQSKKSREKLDNLVKISEKNRVTILSKQVILEELSQKSQTLDCLSLTQLEQELENLERMDY